MSIVPPSDCNPKFQPTRWSMVLLAGGKSPEALRALEDLCSMYWFPLYAWCRARRHTPADAEDFIQGFFLKVIDKNFFSSAKEDRGKLRTYLLTALQRHIRDEQNKQQSARRGGGRVINIDPTLAEATYSHSLIEGETPETAYDRQWALTVLDLAIGTLQKEATARGKSSAFAIMRRFLTDEGDADSYNRAAAELNMSAGAFKVAVHRLRSRFREALRSVVTETQPNDIDPDEEISYLASLLHG